MKRIIAILGLCAACATAKAQVSTNTVWITNTIEVVTLKTNSTGWLELSGPLLDVLRNISTATNLAAYGYGTIGSGATGEKRDFGGGVGVLYNFNDVVGAGARIDYLNSTKTVYMPSFNLQLQAPIYFNSNHTVGFIPFGISGLATPIAGKGKDNGTAVAILGAGAAIKLSKHFDIVGDYEVWTGFNQKYIRIGGLWKF